MSGRHQPLNGADSAEALTGSMKGGSVKDILAHPERYSATLVGVAQWIAGEGRATVDAAYAEERARCAACSLPAVDGEYCAGHARLGEYRVTDETTWAANE